MTLAPPVCAFAAALCASFGRTVLPSAGRPVVLGSLLATLGTRTMSPPIPAPPWASSLAFVVRPVSCEVLLLMSFSMLRGPYTVLGMPTEVTELCVRKDGNQARWRVCAPAL